ncbi:MAG: hypothetical protein ACR2MO_17085 [Acidimicrobiales bacterium]
MPIATLLVPLTTLVAGQVQATPAATGAAAACGPVDQASAEEPEVWGVENLGADGIAIRLVVKTAPNEQLTVARELRGRIKDALDEASIEIPFPQRTVWHRMEEGTAGLVPVGRSGAGD